MSRAALMLAACAAVFPAAVPVLTIDVTARSIQPGELVILTITTPTPMKTVRVRAFSKEFPAFNVDPKTWKALVGVDLDVKPGTYTATISSDGSPAEQATRKLVVLAKAFPTRQLTVDPAFVTPPPEAAAQIERDARDLERVWASSPSDRLWSASFVRPVPDESNSAFGSRSVFNGQPKSPHGGADFLSPAGRPIAAPNAGRVALAHDLYYTGNTVIIDHGQGLFSLFAHLSVISVREGDMVKPGDVVGQVGATGRVTGPHLHWTVRLNGSRIDPLSLLALLGTK